VRILAVGWENLASLAQGPAPEHPGGERLLRLDEPPLSQVGVFAITGPTGSGKSTILDAICLALFDSTPRLGKRGGVKVGRTSDDAELASFDTRNLLRRGTGAGKAICVFEGRDGKQYRATWSVRRARQAPGGRFQKVEMELREEGGAPIGRTNSEVQAEIVDRLGLDFDQFRRSVLLAQGEFAAFLVADESERAELLEKVTGTSLYARIGRQTFERASLEELALDQLRRDLEGLGLLDAEERRELGETLSWLRFATDQADFALGEARETLRRHAELDALRTRSEAADAAAIEAGAAWAAAEPDVSRRDRLRLVKEHGAALSAHDKAARGLQTAGAQVVVQEGGHVAAVVSRDAAVLGWHRAAVAAVAARSAGVAAARGRLSALLAERAAAASELAGREADAQLAAQWDALDGQLAAAEQAVRRLAQGSVDEERLAARLEAAHAALAEREREVVAATEAVVAAEAAETRARSALSSGDPAAALAEAVDQEARLGRLVELQRRADAVQRGVARADAEVAAARERGQVAQGAGDAARGRAATAQLELPGAESALRRARSTAELAQHRPDLVDGEPCPLCGAEEHPFASQTPDVAALLDDLESHVGELRKAVAAENAAASAASARVGLEAQAAERATSQGDERRAELAQIGAEWAETAGSLDGVPGIDAPGAGEALAVAREAQAAAVHAAKSALAARRAAEASAQALSEKCKVARASLDDARGRRDTAQRAVLAGQKAEQEAARRQAEDRARIASLQAGLGDEDAAAFCDEPGAVRARLAERVRAVRELQARWTALGERATDAESSVAAASTTLAVAEERQGRVGEMLVELSLGGSPGDAGGEPTLSERALSEPEAAGEAERALAAERAAARSAERARSVVGEREAAAADARSALDAVLELLAVDEESLRGEVAELPLLPALEARLGQLETAAKTADGVARDRRSHLAERHARRGPPLTPSEAVEVLWLLAGPGEDEGPRATAVRAEHAGRARHEELGRLEQRLAADDAVVARGDALLASIVVQEGTTKLWATMRELIGDAQGRKFRSFAQSLTLDLLLTEANLHLVELEPRYRIERAPPADGRALLALQVVDTDMGDEIRPTSSLSGGEGFLVSLALALALSSLSADGNTVGSLFIDEGFGTLDEKTLETALSVLEALQAGGRQVGIISHVQKLAENIGAQVVVQPEAPGLSQVSVAGPGYS